ncbi:MAG: glycosyltransferase family 2 protein [Ruminococcaceae bacterium]|nr:glycosyltransferase family 2 protein [Oscillospiraceae bacterium]
MNVTFVIMDCYDESTFERCMQSVALQTMEDYEIIVVGMRDMQEITVGGITAKYYTCLDDISDMLETALDWAQGDFVCFIDSVHCFSPFFAEKMTDMCGEDADMAGCGYVGIQRETLLSQVGVPLMMYHPQTLTADEYMGKLTDGDVVSVEMHNYFENKLYRRTMLEKCRPLASEDTIETGIVQKLTKSCRKVTITDEPLLFVCIE